MLQRSAAFKIEFSKPIQLRDGARLATTDHAQMFLSKLAPTQITSSINYARIVLGIASVLARRRMWRPRGLN
jgi:hypothetical protein